MVSQHALQVSKPTPKGEAEGSGRRAGVSRPTASGEVEGSGWGVFKPTTRGKLRGLAGGSPGPHPGGKLRGLAGGSQVPHPEGPGSHRKGGLQAHTLGRVCIPACTEADTPLPEQTATAAGGTHPTGMHSCFQCKYP